MEFTNAPPTTHPQTQDLTEVTDNGWRDEQELVKLSLVLLEDLLFASIFEAYWS
jgi:hypothetical protein